MLIDRRALALAAILFAGPALADVPAPPAEALTEIAEPDNRGTADGFVTSIYDAKLAAEAVRDDLGRATTSNIILYYFTADLLALYKSAVLTDEPVVDVDMFMMAQDWDTKPGQVTSKIVSEDAAGAVVEATVPSFGSSAVVTFDLKKSPAGLWLIDNVRDTRGGDVRAMIDTALKPAP